MKSRRCTASITLMLISAAALQACGGDDDTAARDVYRTRADCQRDWGDDDKKCESISSGPHSGYFYGPMMYGMGRMGSAESAVAPRPGSHAIATHVSRGGFGASASAHGAGG